MKTREELIQMFNHFYELDLDNCAMDHEAWIEQLVLALTDPNYLADFIKEYDQYLLDIGA